MTPHVARGIGLACDPVARHHEQRDARHCDQQHHKRHSAVRSAGYSGRSIA